jgi:hypothetical protein
VPGAVATAGKLVSSVLTRRAVILTVADRDGD